MYVGYIKGAGRIYQQTVVDTYSSVAFAKLYDTKTLVTAADCLNPKALPFFEQEQVEVLRVLNDRGTEYCGRADQHAYQLFLGLNDIEHTRTKVRHPQTNGICERFHQTVQNEFYRVAFRKKFYPDMENLKHDLDQWMNHYNHQRTHQGQRCKGRTPYQTFVEGKHIATHKRINASTEPKPLPPPATSYLGCPFSAAAGLRRDF